MREHDGIPDLGGMLELSHKIGADVFIGGMDEQDTPVWCALVSTDPASIDEIRAWYMTRKDRSIIGGQGRHHGRSGVRRGPHAHGGPVGRGGAQCVRNA